MKQSTTHSPAAPEPLRPWIHCPNTPPPHRSSGGTYAVHGAFDGCVRPRFGAWPAPELLPKAQPANRESFRDIKFEHGGYTDLQSLHSEDAITWSVFGTLIHESLEVRRQWAAELLGSILKIDRPCVAPQIVLWRRMQHPQTDQAERGPELDFMVVDRDFILLGENKWLSNLDERQGVEQGLDQLEIRDLLAQRVLARTHPGVPVYIVHVALPSAQPARLRPALQTPLHYASWSQLCSMKTHPLAEELTAYLAWKRRWANPGNPEQRALLAS